MEEFDYKKFLVENKLTPNSRLLNENAFTAQEIDYGKAKGGNDISVFKFDTKVVPARSYKDEEEVKNNVMAVKKIDGDKVVVTLLSDPKVEKIFDPADLYLYKD